jgi:hypothetical protein
MAESGGVEMAPVCGRAMPHNRAARSQFGISASVLAADVTAGILIPYKALFF